MHFPESFYCLSLTVDAEIQLLFVWLLNGFQQHQTIDAIQVYR
jgi:hypothetical protein